MWKVPGTLQREEDGDWWLAPLCLSPPFIPSTLALVFSDTQDIGTSSPTWHNTGPPRGASWNTLFRSLSCWSFRLSPIGSWVKRLTQPHPPSQPPPISPGSVVNAPATPDSSLLHEPSHHWSLASPLMIQCPLWWVRAHLFCLSC